MIMTLKNKPTKLSEKLFIASIIIIILGVITMSYGFVSKHSFEIGGLVWLIGCILYIKSIFMMNNYK